MTTFVPPADPAVGSVPETDVALLSAAFGDGYTQDAPDGLNHLRDRWSITWPALTRADADEIVAFFVARGGSEPFDYQVPGEAASQQWKCRQWSRPRDLGGRWTVSATFVESFDIV